MNRFHLALFGLFAASVLSLAEPAVASRSAMPPIDLATLRSPEALAAHLLKRPARVNQLDYAGWSILHMMPIAIAVTREPEGKKWRVLEPLLNLLLMHEADLDISSSRGPSPVGFFLSRSLFRAAACYVAYGAAVPENKSAASAVLVGIERIRKQDAAAAREIMRHSLPIHDDSEFRAKLAELVSVHLVRLKLERPNIEDPATPHVLIALDALRDNGQKLANDAVAKAMSWMAEHREEELKEGGDSKAQPKTNSQEKNSLFFWLTGAVQTTLLKWHVDGRPTAGPQKPL